MRRNNTIPVGRLSSDKLFCVTDLCKGTQVLHKCCSFLFGEATLKYSGTPKMTSPPSSKYGRLLKPKELGSDFCTGKNRRGGKPKQVDLSPRIRNGEGVENVNRGIIETSEKMIKLDTSNLVESEDDIKPLLDSSMSSPPTVIRNPNYRFGHTRTNLLSDVYSHPGRKLFSTDITTNRRWGGDTSTPTASTTCFPFKADDLKMKITITKPTTLVQTVWPQIEAYQRKTTILIHPEKTKQKINRTMKSPPNHGSSPCEKESKDCQCVMCESPKTRKVKPKIKFNFLSKKKTTVRPPAKVRSIQNIPSYIESAKQDEKQPQNFVAPQTNAEINLEPNMTSQKKAISKCSPIIQNRPRMKSTEVSERQAQNFEVPQTNVETNISPQKKIESPFKIKLILTKPKAGKRQKKHYSIQRIENRTDADLSQADQAVSSSNIHGRDLESNLENTTVNVSSEKIKDYVCGVCKEIMCWESPEFFSSHLECQKTAADAPILRFRERPTDYEDRKCEFKIIPSDGPSVETVLENFKKENRHSFADGSSTQARVLTGSLVIPPNVSWIALAPKDF